MKKINIIVFNIINIMVIVVSVIMYIVSLFLFVLVMKDSYSDLYFCIANFHTYSLWFVFIMIIQIIQVVIAFIKKIKCKSVYVFLFLNIIYMILSGFLSAEVNKIC